MDLWLWNDGNSEAPLRAQLSATLDRTGFDWRLLRFEPGARAGEPSLGPLLLWQERDDIVARVSAFADGADEIVGPWMDHDEAAARLLRFAGATKTRPARLQLGPLAIDLIDRSAMRDGQRLDLLRREYQLLLHLVRHAGQVQSREALLRSVWRLSFDPGTNVVEVHVSRLRAKLDRGYAWPMLHTIRGAGYALVADAAPR